MQDMPSMRVYPERRPTDDEQVEWERQLDIMVEEHKSYPSIVSWVIYNEGWGQITDYHPEFAITERVRRMDPTRLINANSGWRDHGAGDFSVSIAHLAESVRMANVSHSGQPSLC
jgi:beta-galactosidase/beta-glucuronidase